MRRPRPRAARLAARLEAAAATTVRTAHTWHDDDAKAARPSCEGLLVLRFLSPGLDASMAKLDGKLDAKPRWCLDGSSMARCLKAVTPRAVGIKPRWLDGSTARWRLNGASMAPRWRLDGSMPGLSGTHNARWPMAMQPRFLCVCTDRRDYCVAAWQYSSVENGMKLALDHHFDQRIAQHVKLRAESLKATGEHPEVHNEPDAGRRARHEASYGGDWP